MKGKFRVGDTVVFKDNGELKIAKIMSKITKIGETELEVPKYEILFVTTGHATVEESELETVKQE